MLLLIAALLFCGGRLFAASAQGEAEASGKSALAESGTNVTAIPLTEVAAQAEATFASVRFIEGNLSADEAIIEIQQDLPALTLEASARLEESSRRLASHPALPALDLLDQEWKGVRGELADWKRILTKRSRQLAEDRERLHHLELVWKATQASVLEANLPPEVQKQVERVRALVKRTQDKVVAQQNVVLSLQTQVAEQDGRSLHTLNAIDRAREAFYRRLFVRDGLPIWSAELWSESAQKLGAQSYESAGRQAQSLHGFAARRSGRLVLLGGLFLVILVGLLRARRVLGEPGGEAASLAGPVFDSPVATALVLAVLASSWIFPGPPRLFTAILGAVGIIPAVVVARKVIDQRLFPVLSALASFYLIDQVRGIVASEAVGSRLLLMAEMLGGVVFVGWLVGSRRFAAALTGERHWKFVGQACWVALGWFAAAFLASALGYVSLSKLLSHALLQSAYMALVLYAAVRIVDGLCLGALSAPALARLGVVKRHPELLRRRVRSLATWAATLFWAAFVLEALSLRAPLFQDLRGVLTASWTIGSFKFSPGDVVLFGVTIWASFVVSRLFRFILEEEVYSRVKLAPGLHYSISKIVNYAILLLGFFLAVAAMGFDLTRVTILVGAFGVGLGFGLQNVINNFVSGLILLFERPIKVGDVIQLGGNEGTVKRIGIRASVVEAPNGSELIVPNASLISETVTNWTFSDRLRRIDMPVAVGGSADARLVMDLLKAAALAHPKVLKDPPPGALLGNVSGDSLSFSLRVWIDQAEEWSHVQSELALAVRSTLAEHNIVVK